MKRFVQSDIHLLGEVRGCVSRVEVLEGPTGRRTWPDDLKARIVAESFEPGVRVQGLRMKFSGDDLGHILVVPGGLFAPGLEGYLGS